MTVPVENKTHQDALNDSIPNIIPSALQKARIGDILRALPTSKRRQVPAADTTIASATYQVVKLSDNAKAVSVLQAFSRAGTVTGPLAVVATATPITGQIGLAPNGDLLVLAADAITSLDIFYMPDQIRVAVVTVNVAANLAAIPQTLLDAGVVTLIRANADTATSSGSKLVIAPTATPAPSAGQAALNHAKTSVTFASADAVTRATLTVGIASFLDLDALLKSPSTLI